MSWIEKEKNVRYELKGLGGRKSDLAHDIDVAAQYINERIGHFRLEVILLLADLYTNCA